MSENLRRMIAESLEGLEGWRLEAMARVLRMDAGRVHGNPPFLLGLGPLRPVDGKLRGEVDIGEIHLAPHGAAHGMIPFGLLDNAMGTAVLLLGPGGVRPSVTIEIKVNFLRPLLPGRTIVEGEVVHAGTRIAVAAGRIFGADGELSVLGTGTYYLTSRRLDQPSG